MSRRYLNTSVYTYCNQRWHVPLLIGARRVCKHASNAFLSAKLTHLGSPCDSGFLCKCDRPLSELQRICNGDLHRCCLNTNYSIYSNYVLSLGWAQSWGYCSLAIFHLDSDLFFRFHLFFLTCSKFPGNPFLGGQKWAAKDT